MPESPRIHIAAANPAVIALFAHRLRRVSLALFAAALAIALYAAFHRRGLHADGASFLVRLLERETFDFAEPARRTVLVLLQAPTLLALRLGLVDLAGAVFVFCLTLELVPLVLLALCYLTLPPERRHFFYFPLLHYLAASLSAGASPIVEGLAAAAYFWLLFYLVLFRPLRGAGLGLMVLAAAPALWLHEAMGGLALVLSVAAVWRARREPARWCQLALGALALWFAAVAVIQIAHILWPPGAGSRADLLAGLVGMWWLVSGEGGINVPAWLGLVALVAVNAIPFVRERAVALIVIGFAVLAYAGVALAAAVPGTVSPAQHFGARVNPALLSLLLAAGVLGSLWRPERQSHWTRPSILTLCATLGAAGLTWHAIEVHHWATYVATIRGALAESRGLVSPQAVEAKLAPRERRIFRSMSWHWAFPEISLVLAPRGKVSAIIDRARAVPWRTWDPRDPGQIPKSRFFDTTAYRAAVAGTR